MDKGSWIPLGIPTQQVFEPSGEKAADREVVMHSEQVTISNMKWANMEPKRIVVLRTCVI